MTQPMLEIKSAASATDSKPAHTTPQLLPCRINHDGPVVAADAFWQPTEMDGKTTAYFRGRKLQGQTVKLPADYRGVVGVRRESPREQAAAAATTNAAAADELDVIDVDATRAEQDAQQQRLDTGALDVVAEFDELVVWGHQSTAEAATDPYVRGMDEWLTLSDKIHAYE